MKAVALIGSPRKGGNCDVIVKELMDSIDGDTKTYYLYDQKVGPCQADMACVNQDCVLNDDGNTIINDILDADVLVFSSPIYYGQITGPAKTLIDRFYQISVNPEKTLDGKKVITVFTQNQPEDVFHDYINSFKAMPFGFLGMQVVGNITAMGASEKGDKEQLKEYLDAAKDIASKL